MQNMRITMIGLNTNKTNSINITAVEQTGHNSKITAIASIEQYFSEKIGYVTIPLHKSYADSPSISLRQIAKKFDSIQGELLEVKQMQEILNFIGYESQIKKCETVADLKETIVTQLKADLPLITFFAVNRTKGGGLPIDQYDGSNEVAAVIVGYNEKMNTVILMHQGRKYQCPLTKLYSSMMCLPEQRSKELYRSVKNEDRVKKYDLITEQKYEIKQIKESIQPRLNSGFHGRLVVLKNAPELQNIQKIRKKIILENLNIDYVIKRIANDSGITIEKEGKLYAESIDHAIQDYLQKNDWQELKKALNAARKAFYEAIYNEKIGRIVNTTIRNQSKKRVENFHNHIFTQLVCLSNEEKQEINKQILRLIDHYESCVMKDLGIIDEEQGEIHDQLESLRKVIIPTVYRDAYDSQFIEIKEAMAAFINLLNDETRSAENRKSLITGFSSLLKDITPININTELSGYVEKIYHDDVEEAVIAENIDKINATIQSEWLNDNRRSNLLCVACEKGKEESVKALLKISGVNINYVNTFGWFTWGNTPLLIAVRNNHPNIVKLLKSVSELNPNILRYIDQCSPLYWAADSNNLTMVKELLEIKGIHIDSLVCDATPLSAAARNNNIEMVKILLESGADPRKANIGYSTNQDINSLLQQSIQQCLHRSMKELDYIGNDEGLCLGFAVVNLQAALSGKKASLRLFKLFNKLRQLRLNEYQLSPLTDDTKPEEGKLYVKKTDQFIEYLVKTPSGDTIKDKVEMKVDDPFTIEKLQPLLPDILKITSSRGHTKLSDLKLMQMDHDKLIEQAETTALKEMDCKSINDLNETDKKTFRELVLKKTKKLRESLPGDQREKEDLLIDVRALFDSIEVIMNPHKYSTLFPLKNVQPNDRQVFRHGFQFIKPAFLEKNHGDFLIKQFDGLYKSDELITYFKQLRTILKKDTSITQPIALLLNSYNHAIAVIYYPEHDGWLFVNANKYPRDEKEFDDFIITDDAVIANKVAEGFFDKNALFSTEVYSAVGNNSTLGNNKNSLEKIRLISVINKWFKKLKSCHKVTAEKGTMKLHGDSNYLFLAGREGNINQIKGLLKSGVNVNSPSALGETPLYNIIEYNKNIETIQALFNSEQKVDVNLCVSKTGKTPLHAATWAGRSDIVKFLLRAKNVVSEINPDPVDEDGVNPLFIAAQNGSTEIVRLLLDTKKVDPNRALPLWNITPLCKAILTRHFDIAKLLLQSDKIEADAETKEGASPLYYATHEGYVELVKLLLDSGKVDPNKSYQGCTPLLIAILNKKPEIAKLILQYDDLDLDKANDAGATPLYAAVQEGYTELVKLLLDSKKVDPNKSYHTYTPLLKAILKKKPEIAKLILEYEDLDLDKASDSGLTPLYAAAQEGYTELVKVLMDSGKVDPNKTFKHHTPLLNALLNGRLETVKLLLEYGNVDPNIANDEGVTPLHVAAQEGYTEFVKLVLDSGKVDPNKVLISDGDTALHIAIDNNQSEVIHLLLNSKANLNILNKKSISPLMRAILYEKKDITKAILETKRADVNLASAIDFWTPLHCAAYMKQTDIIAELLKLNADPNVKNSDGFTPLCLAYKNNDLNSVKELLKSDKIDPNLFGYEGSPALFNAARDGYLEIMKALLDKGANPNLARTWDGATPLYMAAQNGHLEAVKMLLEVKADPNVTLTMNGNVPKEYPGGEYPPSPLEIAVKNGHIEIVKLLLSYKAKPFKKEELPLCVNQVLEKYQIKDHVQLGQLLFSFVARRDTSHSCEVEKNVTIQRLPLI